MDKRLLLLLFLAFVSCRQPASDTETPKPAAPEPTAKADPNQVPVWTLDGARKTFGDFRKKVTVVAVWATWCKPCILELPYLQALHERFAKDPDVTVLAACTGMGGLPSPEEIRAITDPLKLTFPLLRDDSRLHSLLSSDDPAGLAASLMGDEVSPPGLAAFPLTVIVGPSFKARRESGFDLKSTKEDYVAKKARLIEQIKKDD